MRRLAVSICLLLVVSCGAAGGVQTATTGNLLIVDDFEAGLNRPTNGGRWLSYDDRMAGGDSKIDGTITAPGAAGTKQGFQIVPKLGDAFAYPFAGYQIFLNSAGTPVDMAGFAGVRLWAKGEGIVQVSVMTSEVLDNNYYSKGIRLEPEWKQFDLSFSELKQSLMFGKTVTWNPKTARGIGFHLSSADGIGTVYIDQIEFYKEP